MKVCLVSSGHSLLDDRITYKEALSIAKVGYEVVVVGRIGPDGVIYDMGRNAVGTVDQAGYLEWNGILLKGVVPPPIDHWASKIYQRFVVRTPLFLGEAAVAESADIYHCHELDSLEAVIYACHKKETGHKPKIIFDSHEHWPYVIEEGYAHSRGKLYGRLAFWRTSRKQARLMSYCDGIIVVNRVMWSYFLLRYPFIPVEVIYNAASTRVFGQVKPSPPFERGQVLKLIHEGSLPFSRGLAEMIALMKKLHDWAPGQVRLTIVGQTYGREARFLQAKMKEYGLNNEVLGETGWLPYNQVGQANGRGHVGLIMMHPLPSHMFSTSNKLFNYINAGLAVIVPDYAGTAYLVRQWQAGAIVRPQHVEDYARVIMHWLEHPQELNELRAKAKQAANSDYNWESMEIRLLQFYDRILSNCSEITYHCSPAKSDQLFVDSH